MGGVAGKDTWSTTTVVNGVVGRSMGEVSEKAAIARMFKASCSPGGVGVASACSSAMAHATDAADRKMVSLWWKIQ